MDLFLTFITFCHSEKLLMWWFFFFFFLRDIYFIFMEEVSVLGALSLGSCFLHLRVSE